MENKSTTIYEDTFFIVPRYIRKIPGITFTFLDVYETIFQFWNKGKSCWLSNKAICERTGAGLTQVKEALLFFEKNGELRRETVGAKRYLIKPEVRIEIEHVAAPPAGGGRSAGQEVAAQPATEYKEDEYKEVEIEATIVASSSQFQNEMKKLFKKYHIRIPNKIPVLAQVRAQKGIDLLLSMGWTLEMYLNYLVENCGGIFAPYLSNGKWKETGFSEILGKKFIIKALNDKYEDKDK
jgi:hypothetical protein